MKIISGSIDVTKIDKSRLIKGEKGTYLNITVFINDEKDKYGNDGMVTQSVTKEEREREERGAILGNVRVVYDKDNKPKSTQTSEGLSDDIPF